MQTFRLSFLGGPIALHCFVQMELKWIKLTAINYSTRMTNAKCLCFVFGLSLFFWAGLSPHSVWWMFHDFLFPSFIIDLRWFWPYLVCSAKSVFVIVRAWHVEVTDQHLQRDCSHFSATFMAALTEPSLRTGSPRLSYQASHFSIRRASTWRLRFVGMGLMVSNGSSILGMLTPTYC